MKIALASDHAGFELKETIKEYLTEHELIDFGSHSTDSMDYPDTGFKAAEAVARSECERGILICGSGLGMSIVANKVKGIRATLCNSVELARLSRKHNDSNILVLQGRFISHNLAKKIIKVWFSTEFDGGRHQRRIDKISRYEKGEK